MISPLTVVVAGQLVVGGSTRFTVPALPAIGILQSAGLLWLADKFYLWLLPIRRAVGRVVLGARYHPFQIHRLILWEVFRALEVKSITARTLNGTLSFSPKDQGVGRKLWLFRQFGHEEVARTVIIMKSLPSASDPSRVLLNVGAHIGAAALPLIQGLGISRSILVEPDVQNVGFLKRNLARVLSSDQYVVHGVAISNRRETGQLFLSSQNHGDHRFRSSDAGDVLQDRVGVRVEARTLDELLRESGVVGSSVGLLWMDVQGHEGKVFEGAPEFFSSPPPTVIEFWPAGLREAGSDPDHFLDFLTKTFGGFCLIRESTEILEIQLLKGALKGILQSSDPHADTDLLLIPRSSLRKEVIEIEFTGG